MTTLDPVSRTTPCSWGEANFGDHLMRTVKVLHLLRQHAVRTTTDIDPAAYPLLFALVATPRRVSELAEVMYVDISTVSRQASTLVERGLVEKLADPTDGRAQVLSLSERGADVLSRLRTLRDGWLGEVLNDWSEQDVAGFTTFLTRFADDVERHRTSRGPGAPAPSTQEPT